jgi:hypothetical protein
MRQLDSLKITSNTCLLFYTTLKDGVVSIDSMPVERVGGKWAGYPTWPIKQSLYNLIGQESVRLSQLLYGQEQRQSL